VEYRAKFPEFYIHEDGYKGPPSNPLNISGNVAARINRDILDLLSTTDSISGNTSPRAAFEKLLDIYRSDSEGMPDDMPAYEKFIDINVLANRYGVLSLRSLDYLYLGGAHGMYGFDHLNYDLYENRILEFADVFSRDNLSDRTIREKLTKKAAAILADSVRKELGRKLSLEETDILKMNDLEIMQEGGYFVGDAYDKFEISENFGLTPRGIVFVYNPYEIASYARGMVEVFISYEELKPFLSENSPVRRMFVEEIDS
jgi:hypothetical protein